MKQAAPLRHRTGSEARGRDRHHMTDAPPARTAPGSPGRQPVPMEMLARVASMYYLDDMTQDQIAKQLGLSRPKVWRLLRQAKETGVVEITVNLPASLAMPVETELTSRFGLSGAILVADQHDESAIRAQVGRAAAGLVDRLLPDGGTLAIGMGRNAKAVSQQ